MDDSNPPPAQKWSRRKDERPTQIVASALRQFARHGFSATKLDDVAKGAGVSKGTIYLYFATKEDLFRAVVRQELLPNLDMIETVIATYDGSSGDLLRLMVSRLNELQGSDLGCIPLLVLAEADHFPEIARFYADEVIARFISHFDAVLRRGVTRGEFRPVTAAQVLPIFVGPLLVLLLWRHSIGRHSAFGFDPKMVLETHIEMFLRGIASGTAS